MIEGLKAIWDIFNGPDNDSIVVALLVGWLALIYAQVRVWWNTKRLLKEKDDRIEDLVGQRNFFQDIVLKRIPDIGSREPVKCHGKEGQEDKKYVSFFHQSDY